MNMTDIRTDAALLDRFVAQRDEEAFAELVRRHGPMVRATCLRVLGDGPDVDDAFQAVFVVLVRKAAAVRTRELLGSWLHTVAVRIARKARAALRQRAQGEQRVAAMSQVKMAHTNENCGNEQSGSQADWLIWLDEELQALPRGWRDALILCHLEDLSRTQAAARLRIPEGTLSSRLARAKELLRERLSRRGTFVSVLALGLVLSERAQAELGCQLILQTVRAVVGGAVSAPAAALAKGAVRSMLLKKLAYAAVAAVVVMVSVAGVGVGWHLLAAPPEQPAAGSDADIDPKTDRAMMAGTWKIVSFQIDGQKMYTDDELKKFLVTFDADGKCTVELDGKVIVESTNKIDPTKTPKTLDQTFTNGGGGAGNTSLAIYELKDDTLKACFAAPGDDRPTEFSSKGNTLVVYERKKGK